MNANIIKNTEIISDELPTVKLACLIWLISMDAYLLIKINLRMAIDMYLHITLLYEAVVSIITLVTLFMFILYILYEKRFHHLYLKIRIPDRFIKKRYRTIGILIVASLTYVIITTLYFYVFSGQPHLYNLILFFCLNIFLLAMADYAYYQLRFVLVEYDLKEVV